MRLRNAKGNIMPKQKKIKSKPVETVEEKPETMNYYVSNMETLTLENGTRLSFASGTTYEDGMKHLEGIYGILKQRHKEAEEESAKKG